MMVSKYIDKQVSYVGKVNVGIIGLGAVGERLLKQFTTHEMTEVSAISDVNDARMDEFKKLIPAVSTFHDYRELLEEASVDLVYVAVPPKFHHSIVSDVLGAGKHVLCEKPLANTLEEAEDMLRKASEAGVVHAINFPLPYSGPVQQLADKIKENAIGSVKRIELTMQFPQWPRAWQQNPWIAGREQGGFIREITPHYIQLIQQLFGETKNVKSFIDYPEDQRRCETGFIARMELTDGTPVILNGLSEVDVKEEIAFRIYGDKGVLSLINWGHLTLTSAGGELMEAVRDESRAGLIDELVKALSGEDAQLVTFGEGLTVQEALEGIISEGK